MTFYDIDGTPYGSKEYAADKTILNQAKIMGSYVPYEVKRRAVDYERGDNSFDSKYERLQNDGLVSYKNINALRHKYKIITA